ncbi:hypothetical protein [Planococcus sp. NCCP-2050]|uniref:hypothetical protein n=1 Tax=Planococcus sp. NCCP-2050 TaxID=2944679 RepID=UPI00203B4534|nr:hypothetical protein [Planococcus sp. NCCP-2050]GKW44461.1 hypothetical protein NCCP2050_01530 [Planococcus sp. NCCP-2050]
MVSANTPLKQKSVKERAEKRLTSIRSRSRTVDKPSIKGNLIQPVHVTKSDALVKRIAERKSN